SDHQGLERTPCVRSSRTSPRYCRRHDRGRRMRPSPTPEELAGFARERCAKRNLQQSKMRSIFDWGLNPSCAAEPPELHRGRDEDDAPDIQVAEVPAQLGDVHEVLAVQADD